MSNVFCINGAEPEVQAYALAKYSRSAQSMVDTLAELNREKAENFLNTFYFSYGHRSIADLVHVPMVLEDISMLAAIEVVDETRWDGQERSTRYQDFSKRNYYIPEELNRDDLKMYHSAINLLFEAYDQVTAQVAEAFKEAHPIPEGMSKPQWERTIMARTFDVSRYLLPLATKTAVGQVTSARALEGQISRLFSSPYTEIQSLAGNMRYAAKAPAYNPHDSTSTVAVAPTLVKYAEVNQYKLKTHNALCAEADRIMRGVPVRESPAVTLVEFKSLEEEIACSLIYEASHYPMRQIRSRMRSLNGKTLESILDLGVAYRGTHDELMRPFRSGNTFAFDIYMDIGGFRDMHRHRRCIQLIQDYNFEDYDLPDFPQGSPALKLYKRVMQDTHKVYRKLQKNREVGNPYENYLLPLGTKKRMLMKMDFAELVYITELRTTSAGHISYRRVASDMFKAVAKKHPVLSKGIRVTDIDAPLDFFKR